MISTALKNQNNHVPSQIPNLYFDAYPELSTNSVGALCTANFEGVYVYGGALAVTTAPNGGRPTYRLVSSFLPIKGVINNQTNGNSNPTVASLGDISNPFIGAPNTGPNFTHQGNFTIFAVVNIFSSLTFPTAAFFTDGSNTFWLCGGASQPILTTGTTATITNTVPTGLAVVVIQRNQYILSIRINNGTLNSVTQPNTFLSRWKFGSGRYNSNLYYTGNLIFGRMIAYRRTLSTNEIITVRNYLSQVYGTLAYA
jgi:hypothetical protein